MKNSEVTVFNHSSFGDLRIVEVNGEPWFIAKDVCDALDLTNPTMALSRLDSDERAKFNLGRQGDTNIINEYGLYNLVLASRKAEAKQYKRWVTHEVLPSIHRHGGYISPRASEHQVNALIFQARARMELCQAAKGIIHPDHLEAKARIILAQGLGEHPTLEPGHEPLYVQSFLKEKNLPTKQLRKVSGTFGKRVKAAYVLKHGDDPQKYPLEIKNGQIKHVYAYTEADRGLMERVWGEHYAGKQVV